MLHRTMARVMACRVASWSPRMVARRRVAAQRARDSALDRVRHITARGLGRRAGAHHGKPQNEKAPPVTGSALIRGWGRGMSLAQENALKLRH